MSKVASHKSVNRLAEHQNPDGATNSSPQSYSAKLPDSLQLPDSIRLPNLSTIKDTVHDKVSSLIPYWVKRWQLEINDTSAKIWIEPRSISIPQSDFERFAVEIKKALDPYPVRILSPRLRQKTDQQQPVKAPQPTKPVPDLAELQKKISKTIPAKISVYRTIHYRVSLPEGVADFVVMRVHALASQEKELRGWRDNFEQENGVSVFFSRSSGANGLQHQLSKIAENEQFLTKKHIDKIRQCKSLLCGPKPGNIKNKIREPNLVQREDMQHISFIALDGEGTCDREDLVYAERLNSGNIRVLTAFIDVTDFVSPGSDLDKFAQRVSHTIYGGKRSFPTLGQGLAHSLANFALNEKRPAWVVETIIDGKTGKNLSQYIPRLKRAWVKTAEHMTPQQFDKSVLDAQDINSAEPIHPVTPILSEASKYMRQHRTQTGKMVRMEGATSAHEVVAEMMITSKSAIGQFFSMMNSEPIWRIHAAPSLDLKQFWIERAEKLGIRTEIEDFDNPFEFGALLRQLEDTCLAEARELANQILDVCLLKTTFSTKNEGHYGLGLSHYLEIKPRDATGIKNQHQLDAIFRGAERIQPEILEKTAYWRNKRRRLNEGRVYKLRVLEMLEEKLLYQTKHHEFKVVSERKNFVYVASPSFSKWIMVPKEKGRRILKKGDFGKATLDGFDTKEMRFQMTVKQIYGTNFNPSSKKYRGFYE